MKKKVIVIAIPTDFPPYGFVGPDLVPKGLDIDMANYIGDKLGVKTELVPVTSTASPTCRRRRRPVISTLGKNLDREKVIDFTSRILAVLPGDLRAEDRRPKTPVDLAGSRSPSRAAPSRTRSSRRSRRPRPRSRLRGQQRDGAGVSFGQTAMATGASAAGNMMAATPPSDAEYKILLKLTRRIIGAAKGEDPLRSGR